MTDPTRYGATPAEWDFFSNALGLTADMLPTVCNPGAPISPGSDMKKVGKTPSIYNKDGLVAGLKKWTERKTSPGQVAQWQQEPDYGICIQTRRLRALDVDVPDAGKAQAIRDFIQQFAGEYAMAYFPVRWRENSGKCLLAFYVPGDFGKRTVKVDGGVVEFLANGQQFVACGMHESGVPYRWEGAGDRHLGLLGLEPALYHDEPQLTQAQADTLWEGLVTRFGIADPSAAGLRKKPVEGDGTVTDATVQSLEAAGFVLGYGNEGQAFLDCPFRDQHTSESVISATAYFPAGSRGYDQGHFHCLHAHCAGRNDEEFLDYYGLRAADFEDETPNYPDEPAPAKTKKKKDKPVVVVPEHDDPDYPNFEREKDGKIKPLVNNIAMALQRPDIAGYAFGYDDFRGEYMIRAADQPMGWRALEDHDYVAVQHTLETGMCGFNPVPFEAIRREIKYNAYINRFDSAKAWLASLPEWDGVSRVDSFMSDVMGTEDTPYARAMSRYIWTGLAGRVIEPGVKADMAPIFVGAQGARKSTAISMLSPSKEFFAEMGFAEKDDDLSRKIRGKLVMEIAELSGFSTRALEWIKMFIAKTFELWVKKYEERTSTFLRRCLFFASTNTFKFLADDSGERRWLPIVVATEKGIDTDYLKTNREQLWAEGAVLFRCSGVDYADAEVLARAEHSKFAIEAVWQEPIKRWLDTVDEMDGVAPGNKDFLSTVEVLSGALNIDPRSITKANEMALAKAMKRLGWTDCRPSVSGERVAGWQKA